MKHIIERTLFFFKDGDEGLLSLNDRFFSISTLLNRLLNEMYRGEKIQFINIFFSTVETYNLYPLSPKYYTHYYGRHLRYNDVFDLQAFNKLKENEQTEFIWKRAHEILTIASKDINNEKLLEASKYAYEKGIRIGLNPDYKMVEADVIIHGQSVNAAVWLNFKKDGMYSKLTLEKDGVVIFEKPIDKTKNGVEFFLEIYKRIDVEGNTIIIKGRKDVDYLPLKVPIDTEIIN